MARQVWAKNSSSLAWMLLRISLRSMANGAGKAVYAAGERVDEMGMPRHIAVG